MNLKSSIFSKLLLLLKSKLQNQKIRYILVGGWNTAFGYIAGLIIFNSFGEVVNVIIVGLASNFLAITMSYVTNKLIVFKTAGNWISEYFRFWILYGLSTIVGIALLWIFVDYFHVKFWIAQAIVTVLLIFAAYLGNLKFTFRLHSDEKP